jgi:hypothetical protein
MKQILEGFVHEKGVHSCTTALRDVFACAGSPLPEPFFFGIGEGLGFYYWSGKNLPWPKIGGRIGHMGIETRVCGALGAGLRVRESASTARAQDAVVAMLAEGSPVIVYVDAFYLKCLRRGAHFGAHTVVVAGVDEDAGYAFVADHSCDGLHEVPLDELTEARSSRHRPFPPQNRWLEFDVPAELPVDRKLIMGAIGRNALEMLNSPLRNKGIGGIYYFGNRIRTWKNTYSPKEIADICRHAREAIDGPGTDGGCFRYLYADFLDYAANVAGVGSLADVSAGYRLVGSMWKQAGSMLGEIECGCASLTEVADVVDRIASREQKLQISLLAAANLCCQRKLSG